MKLVNKILPLIKKFFIFIAKKLSSFFNHYLKSPLIEKRKQFEDNYRLRLDKKMKIASFRTREEFNKIRINMDTINKDLSSKCILISSPSLSDGKTTICVNMAQYLAKFGKKTVIVDCNMRAPKIKEIFNTDSHTLGLGDILTNKTELNKCILPTSAENLYIITAGCVLDDPVGLLGSAKMDSLIKSLIEEFDFVLLDTPSILLVPDTIPLANYVTNIYLIVRHNFTKNHDVISALNTLSLINRPAKGIIYNDAPIEPYDINFIYK